MKRKKGRAEKLKEEIRFRHGDDLIISISFFRAFLFQRCVFYSFRFLPFILIRFSKEIELMMRKIN
jgi:hypothetical protein